MGKPTLTLYPDMSDHPGPIQRAQLVLEIGPHRIESATISAKRAEEALEAIKRAFGDAIAEGKHGYGDIM